MDFYFGLAQIIGVHTLLGLSAYIVLLTGQVTLAQAGFFAIGAYVSAMLTVLAGWPIVAALGVGTLFGAGAACAVGFPALRVKGLMLVIATLAFGEGVRLFFFNFDYQVAKGQVKVGPVGGEGFRQIRYFPEHGWTTFDVMLFVWAFVVLIMAILWWFDARVRGGAARRSRGRDRRAVGGHQSDRGEGECDDHRRRDRRDRRRTLRALHHSHRAFELQHPGGDVRDRLPIVGGLASVFGTLAAVVFVQGFLIEGLRFLGDWRNLLFGALIVLAMNVRPRGLLDAPTLGRLGRLFGGGR